MLGAIVGDIIGSIWEGLPVTEHTNIFDPHTHQYRITDDTICHIAIAEGILHITQPRRLFQRTPPISPTTQTIANHLRKWYHRYPNAGYGFQFSHWAQTPNFPPYHSYGNGAAMRSGCIAQLSKNTAQRNTLTELACSPTHNDPITVASTKALNAAIHHLHQHKNIDALPSILHHYTGMQPSDLTDRIQRNEFIIQNKWCVAIAFTIAQRATSYEHGVHLAMQANQDTDTQASITGNLLAAIHPIPPAWVQMAQKVMPEDIQQIYHAYCTRTHIPTQFI